MDFESINKLYYWIFLDISFFIVIIIIVVLYKITILSSPAGIIILLVFFALLLSPLYAEIDLMGIELKRDIKKVKGDVKDLNGQILTLRSEVINSIHLSQNQSTNFIFNQNPPPDSELPKIQKEKDVKFNELKFERTVGLEQEFDKNIKADDDVLYLFSTRYAIEKELRRIWNYSIDMKLDEKQINKINIRKIISDLTNNFIIEQEIANTIIEVINVCNAAIHTQEVTSAKIDFVKDLGPKVISSLKNIRDFK